MADVELKPQCLPNQAGPTVGTTSGYYDTDLSWIRNESVKAGVVKYYPYACKTAAVMSRMGEVVADFLGFTQAKHQYALDEYHRQKERMAQRQEVLRQARMDRLREQGLLDDDDDLPYAPPLVVRYAAVSANTVTDGAALQASAPVPAAPAQARESTV